MNIVAADTAPPHFFLIGFRTPPGALFDKDNPNAQHLGAVVLRTKMQVGGAALAGGDVMTADEPYPTFKPEGPFRLEAEIAPWKPALDVVVIDRLESFLTAAQQLDLGPPPNAAAVALHIAASHFGTVAIDRGAGFGVAVARPFGWLDRGAAPRLNQAGRSGTVDTPADPSSLANFDASLFDLPDDYDNAFQSGQPLPGEAPLGAGDRLQFVDALGPVIVVAVPPAPVLALSLNGAPLNPAVTLQPLVDTVVLDRAAGDVTLTWRATFLWEDRLEAADLEIG